MTENRDDKNSGAGELLLRGLTSFLGHLPAAAGYVLARGLAFVARRILRYRLRVVRANIRHCFPEMSLRERREVEKDFYQALGRYIVETPRMKYMSEQEIKSRMEFRGAEEAERILASGRSIAVYTAHFGNWEWETSFPLWFSSGRTSAHIYRPLKNKAFDEYFISLRSRFSLPVKQKSTLRQLLTWKKQGIPSITGFLSDQKPGRRTSEVTVPFFSSPTPFIYGTEELARKLDMAVGYFDLECKGVGKYVCTFRLIAENPASLPEGEITARYAAMLESTIRRATGEYLWSHNRWRWKKENLKADKSL